MHFTFCCVNAIKIHALITWQHLASPHVFQITVQHHTIMKVLNFKLYLNYMLSKKKVLKLYFRINCMQKRKLLDITERLYSRFANSKIYYILSRLIINLILQRSYFGILKFTANLALLSKTHSEKILWPKIIYAPTYRLHSTQSFFRGEITSDQHYVTHIYKTRTFIIVITRFSQLSLFWTTISHSITLRSIWIIFSNFPSDLSSAIFSTENFYVFTVVLHWLRFPPWHAPLIP
jgi:hypothetical protein